jgi:hypothetical protein
MFIWTGVTNTTLARVLGKQAVPVAALLLSEQSHTNSRWYLPNNRTQIARGSFQPRNLRYMRRDIVLPTPPGLGNNNTCAWTHCLDDDVAFTMALLQHLSNLLCVDDGSVFAMVGDFSPACAQLGIDVFAGVWT